MKINKLHTQLTLLGLAGLVVWSCASSGNGGSRKRSDTFRIPPGVDSTVAREADSLNRALFVDSEAEKKSKKAKQKAYDRLQRSDSLWHRIVGKTRVTADDSAASHAKTRAGKEALHQMQQELKGENHHTADPEIYKKVDRLLREAIDAFERALELNPYDMDARSWLARTYALRAERLERREDYENAARVLEDLLQLEKGQHQLYFRLAENYFKMQAWQPAYDLFVQAERMLKETAFLNPSAPEDQPIDLAHMPLDTATLFYYRYYQGVTQVKLYHAEKALEILDSARDLVRTPENRKAVEDYIAWIKWDNGNIRGSEIRDSLLVLQQQGKFAEAAGGFRKLIRHLTTQRARDEIIWRAALIEYEKLGQKNKAVAALHELIKRTATDSNGLPADSSYRRYFNDYAIMCYNLGLDYSKARHWQDAYAYLSQASLITWPGRAKCHIEIAKIVQNNPDLVIKHCNKAVEEIDALVREEKVQLYQLLIFAYLKKGMTDQARHAREKLLQLQREAIDNGTAVSR